MDNDLISRQAVSSWLKQYGQDVLHGKYKFSLMYIWKNLMDLPSAQPEQQWIPVSERLPEEDGKYMVTIHGYGWNGKTFTSVSVAECIGKRWVGNNGVIAWMPLPEPYRKGAAT